MGLIRLGDDGVGHVGGTWVEFYDTLDLFDGGDMDVTVFEEASARCSRNSAYPPWGHLLKD